MKKENALTDRENAVYEYLKSYIAENGRPPSRSELAKKFLISRQRVGEYLLKLQKKGCLKIIPEKHRGLDVWERQDLYGSLREEKCISRLYGLLSENEKQNPYELFRKGVLLGIQNNERE